MELNGVFLTVSSHDKTMGIILIAAGSSFLFVNLKDGNKWNLE